METGLELAVIGMAGRFPGAENIHEFWNNLKNGIESIAFFSDEELIEAGIEPGLLENPNYINARGVLQNFQCFDYSFFGYTPKEAEAMDPQIRIFHECAWAAMEDAGYEPGAYDGLIGLYAGASPGFNWEARCLLSGKSAAMGHFSANQLSRKDYLSLRISYKFNLNGPSFTLNTACSTSLVAIHLACQAILNGECDMALAGGVTVFSTGKTGYLFQEGMIASPDGHCKAFDAEGSGIVSGEGVGVVMLKRLEDAVRDRDYIYSIVKGSAINNDGIRKAGFTAPSVEGQAEVIKMALQVSEVEPESISYIETHGTATELGDTVEIEALKLAFNTGKKGFCAVGSVKTNVGHVDSASGVAGFIKTVLALKNRLIPPSLFFNTPNPQIDFVNSPFYVNSKSAEWENGQYPLRAGVSSFGIGGSNAHVILEEWPGNGRLNTKNREQVTGAGEYHLIVLSARTSSALDKAGENLRIFFEQNKNIDLADVVYTLQLGKKAFNHRWMGVCSTVGEAVEMLDSPGGGETRAVLPKDESAVIEEIEPTADKVSLTRIGRLWLQGGKIDWDAFYTGEVRYRIPLPTYPFEKQRFWIDDDHFKRGAEMWGKKENTPAPPDIADWFYLFSWKRSVPEPRKDRKGSLKGRWLLFVNELNLGSLLVKTLKESGADVVTVKMGNAFKPGENDHNSVYIINPREKDHYDALFNELKSRGTVPDRIAHLWGVNGEDQIVLEAESFNDNQYKGFYSMLYMVKAIGEQDFSHDIQITVLTDHLQEVFGGEPLNPGKATVLGLLKSIPQEYPGIRCRSIDIEVPEPGSTKEAEFIDTLLKELASDTVEPVIAYRNNHRWIQIFEPIHLAEPKEGRLGFREQGVYLITGGLGTIGFIFSELFVKHSGARLILTGRSEFPPKAEWNRWLDTHDEADPVFIKIKKLQKLEDMGGQVLYIRADVADLHRMRNAVNRADETFGKINGVIHAAGIIEGKSMLSIRQVSQKDCLMQFQAKVYGPLVLEELFSDRELDFCWMLSSISCVLGGLGFGAYASANMFMDSFVKRHNRLNVKGSPWFTLNWDGMNAEMSTSAFERMFPLEKIDQLVFSNGGNLQERIDKWVKLETARKGEPPGSGIETTSAFHPRPDISSVYVAPLKPAEIAVAGIWQRLLGYEKIGIKDDFLELGGDSLKAITVISRIHRELSVNIPVTEFFNEPTVESLARYVLNSKSKDIYVSINPVEKKEFYPLSAAQRRIYILHRMNVESKSYNVANVVRLKGPINRNRLEDAFKQLIGRHESLRTSFVMFEEGPVQVIRDEVEFSVEYNEGGEKEAAEIVKNFIRPFDLAKAPLLRVGLIKTGDEAYVLMLDLYHLISDAVSLKILVKDFFALYGGEKLSPLRIQYKDFSEWQNRLIHAGLLKRQKEFWLDKFKDGDIPVLNMPLDYPRPALRNIDEGDTLFFRIDEAICKKLYNVVGDAETTLFMVLFAAYYVLLSKYTKQEDIVVGTLLTGRAHADLENVLGIFVNTLAIRNYPQKNKAFRQFLKEVKSNALLAYENQDYSFDTLIIDLGLQGDAGRNPLFDTLFTLDIFGKEAAEEIQTPDFEIEPLRSQHTFAKFDLYFEAKELAGEIIFMVRYSTQLFKPSTVQKIAEYYIEILAQVVDDIDVNLRDITLSHDFLTAASTVHKDDGRDFEF